MNFDLFDYQDDAAAKVLKGLVRSSGAYEEDGEYGAVSLSAPTGAGKTVIAAAVIERMLFGDPEGVEEARPESIFLWLTDDPSLNEQTRKKILAASDKIQSSQLVTLDESFDAPELSPGKVYFLNIQKLRKGANFLVRREGKRAHLLLDAISATIRNNGGNYYLIRDEAHRGTGRRNKDDATISQRLTNGDEAVLASPVVLGISATLERFEDAIMGGAVARVSRKVEVPVAAVRESGLIKDILSITYRAESQVMDATLVREAAGYLRSIDEAWNRYTKKDGHPPVRPALVVQIPPNMDSDDLGELLDVCVEEWSVLGGHQAMAHALESHSTEEFGNHIVSYVKPQDIQDHPHLRLVIFKEALTTGWDCPRAEVMVSLRKAKDSTYIAQLIGRMVRSPLAKRIESDETLNRVRLILPGFDRAAVDAVKDRLEREEGGLPTDIEIDAVDAHRNRKVRDEAFAAVEALPSYQVPGPVHRSQVARLHRLAALLSGDELLEGAIRASDEFLVGVLESERKRISDDGELKAMLAQVENAYVESAAIASDGSIQYTPESVLTAARDIDRLFSAARRRLRDGLADRYWSHRVTTGDDPYDAKILVIALAAQSAVVEKVEGEAEDRVRQWLDSHGDEISQLSEDKRARYARVRAMAQKPEEVKVSLPSGAISMPGDSAIATYEKHLFADKSGKFRAKLLSWEQHCLEVESSRDNFVAWYRNPAGGQRSLRIPYLKSDGYGKVYPDIVVLHEVDGEVQASIIDPHGHHLADAGDKLRGLAQYAEAHGNAFARVIAVIKNAAGDFRMLDLTDEAVNEALQGIHTQSEIEGVFAGHGASYG